MTQKKLGKTNNKSDTVFNDPYFKETLFFFCLSLVLLAVAYCFGVFELKQVKILYTVTKPMLFPVSLVFIVGGIMHLKRGYWFYASMSIMLSLLFLFLS
ncbi:hypothetical protein QU577_27645 [Priestia megaterium]|uniref:hypothetical protein n=1 Tax=Priestia megaterium TaxID=1404 RepID=UPI0025B1A9A6|nr:hypothetical protein [Priestia megaterium]MDN3365520.1 hypothetical protein [Priestia megaterium]